MVAVPDNGAPAHPGSVSAPGKDPQRVGTAASDIPDPGWAPSAPMAQ